MCYEPSDKGNWIFSRTEIWEELPGMTIFLLWNFWSAPRSQEVITSYHQPLSLCLSLVLPISDSLKHSTFKVFTKINLSDLCPLWAFYRCSLFCKTQLQRKWNHSYSFSHLSCFILKDHISSMVIIIIPTLWNHSSFQECIYSRHYIFQAQYLTLVALQWTRIDKKPCPMIKERRKQKFFCVKCLVINSSCYGYNLWWL